MSSEKFNSFKIKFFNKNTKLKVKKLIEELNRAEVFPMPSAIDKLASLGAAAKDSVPAILKFYSRKKQEWDRMWDNGRGDVPNDADDQLINLMHVLEDIGEEWVIKELWNKDPEVREGAIYNINMGTNNERSNNKIKVRLKYMAEHDENPRVRKTAKGFLDK